MLAWSGEFEKPLDPDRRPRPNQTGRVLPGSANRPTDLLTQFSRNKHISCEILFLILDAGFGIYAES